MKLIGHGTCNKKTITFTEKSTKESYDKYLSELKSEYKNIKLIKDDKTEEWLIGGKE